MGGSICVWRLKRNEEETRRGNTALRPINKVLTGNTCGVLSHQPGAVLSALHSTLPTPSGGDVISAICEDGETEAQSRHTVSPRLHLLLGDRAGM